MASRRKHPTVKRTGLRSQKVKQDLPVDDGGWATEDEEGGAATSIRQPAPGTREELVEVMRTFLKGQEQRDKGFLAELRGLRATFPAPQLSVPVSRPASPFEESTPSLRVDPPTPAPRRGAGAKEAPRISMERAEPARHEGQLYGDPKIPQYVSGEDIENYLLRFERIARTWGWPEGEWACRLVPLLTGKALEAYTAMDEESAHSYPDLKAALLIKFDVSPETYRQQFRSISVPAGESSTETYHRLKGLYRRWIRPEQHSKEQIGEQIILEQLLHVLPADVRTWVKEHEPTEGLAAARLALQYRNARRGGPAAYQDVRQPSSQPRASFNPPRDPGPAPSQRGPGKELICFYCQQSGHKAALCPIRKAKLTGACYTPRAEDMQGVGRKQWFKEVCINGEPVTALVDSGSFMTLVRRDFVPTGLLDYIPSRGGTQYKAAAGA
ncbi:uncharacterized protein LOC105924614 [Fundulus heteroclitus]|uniref:uncharacterized protein LOC105924614 n=1 Tax=Fundulus heteroclitus TaxID=8078 RepID=UPI00165AF7C8|nr:uncharacterized protein LOC105924614 [Fundulus heteroclitus]